MLKKLTLLDYIYSLVFIFLLICVVGAFFFGVQIGKDRSAAKYEELLTVKKGEEHQLDAYHQQYLVSFYHTVFLPYREFQKNWFDTMTAIELRTNSRSGEALVKDMAAIAQEKYAEIKKVNLPSTSTLLIEAQTNFLQSLKLFASAAGETDLDASGLALIQNIDQSAFYTEAKNFGLEGLTRYYRSIRLWNESEEPLTNKALASEEALSIEEWNSLNLNLKNEFISNWMLRSQYYNHFYVQDLVLRIDELIQSGQADKMNIKEVTEIADTLVATKAVRYGDFIIGKTKYYETELLPQLPFFFAEP